MPHAFAAVVPHTPLLIPEVAKAHQRIIAGTRAAVETLAAECYAAQPDVLVIFSPHGPRQATQIIIHQQERLVGNLKEFGGLSLRVEARGALGFTHQLRELAQAHAIPTALQTFDELDYGTTVPASFFLRPQTSTQLVSILLGQPETTTTLRFGQLLQEYILSRPERCAVLASADLQRRSKSELARLTDRPTPSERLVAEAISSCDPSPLTSLTTETSFCGWQPILALLAYMRNRNAHGTIRSFEVPFGVGLLVASLEEA